MLTATSVSALNEEARDVGAELHNFVAELYPICRSITGPGLRETFARIGDRIPLQITEVPSGTRVFGWEIPREWSIRDAYIKDASGRRIVDFRESNLHVVNYSAPIQGRFTWEQLRPHLYALPQHPDWIPYRTAYYDESWGFCLTHRQLQALEQRPHEVYDLLIDSELQPGSLSFGECIIPGLTSDEVLFSCHVCHPSLANDNLASLAVAVQLAEDIARRPRRRYTYRFLFVPGTIGPIAWLSQHEEEAQRIRHGLVLALLGDAGGTTYKRSRHGDAAIDRVTAIVLRDAGGSYELREFSPIGYDERQFGSPGFDLPVGCLMRTPHGEYAEYHTSADNLELVRPEALEDSLQKCRAIVEVLELNERFQNQNPKCEPQLGKRGLYQVIGGEPDPMGLRDAILWLLNLSDGNHALLDIAERSGLPFEKLARAAVMLTEHGLLRPVGVAPF